MSVTASALWCTEPFLTFLLLQQNLSKQLTVINDKLSCDSRTGGWWVNDMMMDRLGRPAGFIEVMFRMHVLWHLMALPREVSDNGMRSNDQGSHTRVMLQCELSFLTFLLLPFNLSPSHESNPAPSQCCSLKAYSKSCTSANWDNCVAWAWAAAVLIQLFLLWGNRVAQRFHGDFIGSRVLEMYPSTAQML